MKFSAILIIFLFAITSLKAQVFPGTPVAGFPSGTTAQITSVPSPVEGTVAYSTDEKILYYYNGTNWVTMNGNGWSLSGNSGTTAANFLGTTDTQNLIFRTNNIEALRINQTNQYVGLGITATSPLHIRRNLADGVGIIRVEGTEPDINFNDTDGGFNTFTFENNGTPRFAFGRRNTDDFYITRNNGAWRDETFNILNSNGHVGINTDAPSEMLDINGKLRIRDINTVTTNNEILTTTNTGVVEKKALIAAETNNQVTTGANGGVYLGPTVHTGFFIINAPGGTTATAFNQVITGLPFQPSQITFVAHANVESLSVNSAGSGGLNTATLQNAFGTANGFARNNGGGTITQATIYVGGSGSSINSISRYSSNSQCFGLRYGNQNAVNMGIISGSLSTFNADGFTINVNYSLGTSGNAGRDNDILDESLVVLYTAYR